MLADASDHANNPLFRLVPKEHCTTLVLDFRGRRTGRFVWRCDFAAVYVVLNAIRCSTNPRHSLVPHRQSWPLDSYMFHVVLGPLTRRVNTTYLPPSATLDYYVIRSNLPKPQGKHTTTVWCFLSTPGRAETHVREGVRGDVPGIKQSRFLCIMS